MSDNRPIWAHALPTAILLMAPFDLLASLAMDIYLPVTPAMPAPRMAKCFMGSTLHPSAFAVPGGTTVRRGSRDCAVA